MTAASIYVDAMPSRKSQTSPYSNVGEGVPLALMEHQLNLARIYWSNESTNLSSRHKRGWFNLGRRGQIVWPGAARLEKQSLDPIPCRGSHEGRCCEDTEEAGVISLKSLRQG